MKLYRRFVKINLKDEMHLQVDHYLSPLEITEEDIEKILMDHSAVRTFNADENFNEIIAYEVNISEASKAILDKLES